MSDLISRQDAIDAINRYADMLMEDMGWNAIHRNDAIVIINSLPSAEQKGKWVKDEFGSRCSKCGLYAYRDRFDRPWESNFCPNCGADTRGGTE